MAYIFLDESGDLGFDWKKQKTSRYFLITTVFVESKRPLEKIVRKIFAAMSKKERKAMHGCLHCYKAHPRIRQKLLTEVNQLDLSIMTISLNKKKVYSKLHDEKHVLYNFVVNILLDRLYTRKLIPIDQPIHLVASQRETNTFLNVNFQQYLTQQVEQKHQLRLSIAIKPPSAEKGLQVADFLCWALFRKREHADASYADLIHSKVVEERPLFP